MTGRFQPVVPPTSSENWKLAEPKIVDLDLKLNNMPESGMIPDGAISQQNQYIKNTFSPASTGPNPKVSNSAISIVKTGDHLICNNQSLMDIQFEFNRSHQGEGFHRKIHNLKKNDNIELPHQMQASSVIENNGFQRVQHETKRGSSHSHHTGGGNRSNFKNNTSNYENQGIILHNINGMADF